MKSVTPQEFAALDGGLAGALGQQLGRGTQAGGLELTFTVDHKIFDGRFGNNVWLQELPHPITKITWDNAAMISPAIRVTSRAKRAISV